MSSSSTIPWQQPEIIQLSYRIFKSFEYWLKHPLIEEVEDSPEAIAQALFEAPFVLVSQDAEPDPISNYANRMALEQFDLDWEVLTQMPSRYSTQPIGREERKQLSLAVRRKGFLPHFHMDLSMRSGQDFLIEDCTLWYVLDEQQKPCGQATIYSQWTLKKRSLFS